MGSNAGETLYVWCLGSCTLEILADKREDLNLETRHLHSAALTRKDYKKARYVETLPFSYLQSLGIYLKL